MKEELEQAFAAIKNGEEEQARVLLARMLKDDPDYVPGWVLLSKLAPNRIQKAAFLDKILTLDPEHNYARQELEALGAGVERTIEGEPAEAIQPEATPIEVSAVDTFAGEMVSETTLQLDEGDLLPAGDAVEDQMATGSIEEGIELEPGESEEALAEPAVEDDETRMTVSTDPHDYEAQASGDTLPPWLADDEALLIDELAGQEIGDDERMPPEPDLPDWLKEEPASDWDAAEKPAGGAVRLREQTTAPIGQRAPDVPERRRAAPSVATPPWLLIVLSIALVVVFLLLIYFGIRLLG